MYQALLIFAASGVTAALACPLVIALAHRIRALDLPGPRKVHLQPIPRLGGLAVFAGFIAGVALAAHLGGVLFSDAYVTVYWYALAAAAALMFFAGLVDDIRGLSFVSKFAVQIAGAVAVWLGGFRIDVVSLPLISESIDLGAWSLPVTVFWIVAVTNAINLIDGLDGLAAGVALIIASSVATIAAFRGFYGVVAASVALVGALAGFLVYNFNPARLFLGDSGSLFLGFVIAVVSIRSSQKGTTAVAVVTPLLIVGLPILDTALAVARRSVRLGRAGLRQDDPVRYLLGNVRVLFHADRGHIHHRLMDLGLTHRGSVLTLYALALALALGALSDVFLSSLKLAVVLIATLWILITAFVAWILWRRRNRLARLRRDSAVPAPAGGARDH